jgi:hypothetical protein
MGKGSIAPGILNLDSVYMEVSVHVHASLALSSRIEPAVSTGCVSPSALFGNYGKEKNLLSEREPNRD